VALRYTAELAPMVVACVAKLAPMAKDRVPELAPPSWLAVELGPMAGGPACMSVRQQAYAGRRSCGPRWSTRARAAGHGRLAAAVAHP
jgi:hypothetical protein